MILFNEDFCTHSAVLHTATTNTSFIRMHALLKSMGIVNNKFFLTLIQSELANIKPHELTDPSLELVAKIAYEIKVNPWYYYREIVRIPAAGINGVPFRLNRANLAMLWCFYNNIDIIEIIPRQTGKTMTTQSIVSHIKYFMCTNFTIAMLTKDTALLQENVKRLKDIRDNTPPYLLALDKLKDSERKEGLYYHRLKNQYQTFVCQSDTLGAEKLGRGQSTPMQHWDETAFFKNIEISYPAAVNATNAAAEQAAAVGLPHTNILTTTAGNLDTPEGRFTKGLIDKSVLFSEKFYDCANNAELKQLVKTNSQNNMIYAVFSYLQLGKTHEWFKEKSTRSAGSQDSINRDFLNIWTAGKLGSVLDPALLKKVRLSVTDPVHTSVDGGYIFRWYQHPDHIFSKLCPRVVIAGLDSSENIGNDFTSLVFTDASDMSVLCTARCNEADLLRFANWLGEFMITHPEILLVPERKSTASMIISIVCEKLRKRNIDPLTRIYNHIYQHRDEEPFRSMSLERIEETTNKKHIGYSTTGSGSTSRDILYKTVLVKTVEMNHTRIYDQVLCDEMSNLVVKNGRIDHASGLHDDLLFAYLLTCWFVYFGRHRYMYATNENLFLSQVTMTGERVSADLKKAQLEMKQRIEDLEYQISRAQFPAIKNSLQRELNGLKTLFGSVAPVDDTPLVAETMRQANTNNKFNVQQMKKCFNILR